MTRERNRIQENANEYIVKNCPSCRYTPKRYIDGIDYICWNAQNFNNSARGLCQDCTDCVIKQMIEECKWETNIDVNDRGDLAERVLSFFDIEEIK